MRQLIITLLFLFSLTGFVHAEEVGPGIGESMGNLGLQVNPMTPEEGIKGFKKMEKDIQALGEGLAPALSKYSLIAGVVLMVVGILVSRKIMKVGIGMIALAFFVYFVLGDMSKTQELLRSMIEGLQSYF